jgi:hypothetical protein
MLQWNARFAAVLTVTVTLASWLGFGLGWTGWTW